MVHVGMGVGLSEGSPTVRSEWTWVVWWTGRINMSPGAAVSGRPGMICIWKHWGSELTGITSTSIQKLDMAIKPVVYII